MRDIRTLILLCVSILCISGISLNAETYRLDVGQFNRLKISDNVNVIYRCLEDSTGMAVFEGDRRFADAFIFSNSGGQLRIQVNTEDVNDPELPTVYVYSDYLTSVENGSEFTLTVETPHSCPEFKATQVGNGTVIVENITATEVKGTLATGNGRVILSGECQKANLSMVGTGLIQADRLKARDVQCSILGSGTIGCWPTSFLKVRGLGSTKIYYKGSPKIKKSGGGKLFPIDESRDGYYVEPAQ